jgi:hypothetical protein
MCVSKKPLLALVAIAAVAPLHAQNAATIAQPGVITIEISSSWGGMGTPARAAVTITRQNGVYSSTLGKVDAKAVEELLAALDGPVMNKPSLEDCGAGEAWLTANYTRALEDYTHRKLARPSTKQVSLFKARFVDLHRAQADFEELFKQWHTDDFPKMSVTVKTGGQEYGIRSESQHPFLLPWYGTDRARGGYSCRVSRALAPLFPKGFPNRDRLVLGDRLRSELTQQIMSSIRHDWDLLDTENRVGPELGPVFARFTVLESQISNLSSIDLDGDQAWNAKLALQSWPSNFAIGASLPYHGKPLGGVDSLMVDAPRYAAAALSVPWLRKYVEGNSQVQVEMRYVNGRSISPKAIEGLREDMKGRGREDLLHAVAEHLAESVFLEVQDRPGCWSRIIVLPNGDSILWQFQCNSPLQLPAASFKTWDCYGWRCTGTLIAPDGKIRN